MHKKYIISLAAALLLQGAAFAEEGKITPGKGEEVEESSPMYWSGEQTSKWWGDLPPAYYPITSRWLAKVSVLGDSLEIDDGSVWAGECANALGWKTSDPLFITQNWNWFSKYAYRIVNRQSSSTVYVNLKMGPLENGSNTYYIAQLDRRGNDLILSDNSNWIISTSDQKTFWRWKEGQAIIVGINSGWEGEYDMILINVNANNFVRARQY